MREHQRVRWWLDSHARLIRHDPDSTVHCLGDASAYEWSTGWQEVESWIKADRSVNKGGWCEDCLRKLGLLW